MRERSRGMIALGAAVIIWAVSPLFIAYLCGFYDPFTQNLFRYLATCACLVGLRVAQRAPVFPKGRVMLLLLAPLAANLVFQTFNVFALYHAQPGIVALVGKLSVVFASVMAYAFFREERLHIRSLRFVVGTALALGGVAGLYTFKIGEPDPRFMTGMALAIVGAAGWGSYIIAVKFAMRSCSPAASFTVVSLYTTAVFAVLAFLGESPCRDVRAAGVGPAIVLIVSGVLCIGVAHVCYYDAIKRLGAAIPATAILVSPVITVASSRLLFGEHLSAGQLLSGAVLLSGAFLALGAQTRDDSGTLEDTPKGVAPLPDTRPKKH